MATCGRIMSEKAFTASSRQEAEKLAGDWVISQRGIKVSKTRVIGAGAAAAWPLRPINLDMWTVIVEYDD